jgi:hypothetical protein
MGCAEYATGKNGKLISKLQFLCRMCHNRRITKIWAHFLGMPPNPHYRGHFGTANVWSLSQRGNSQFRKAIGFSEALKIL